MDVLHHDKGVLLGLWDDMSVEAIVISTLAWPRTGEASDRGAPCSDMSGPAPLTFADLLPGVTSWIMCDSARLLLAERRLPEPIHY